MSILELIVAGSMDCLLAAILWLMVDHRSPFVVVAGPSNAGKSTNLEALLAFLPAEEVIIPLKGMSEDFAFLQSSDPGKTCLLCAEISDGLPFYLWGRKVVTLFECLRQGYTLGTTMHAQSAAEAITILLEDLRVPADLLLRLGFVMTLGIRRNGRSIERWVRAVDTIKLTSGGSLVEVPVYRRQTPDMPAFHKLDNDDVARALALKAGVSATDFDRNVRLREAYLAALRDRGVMDYADVRSEIIAFEKTSRG